MNGKQQPRIGVTLIETIMVIALLATAAVTGVILFDGEWVARRSVTSVTNDVANSLVTAHNTAITNQATVRVRRARQSGTEQLLFTEDAGPFRTSKSWIVELGPETRLSGSPTEIRFSPTGTADRAPYLDDHPVAIVRTSRRRAGERSSQSSSAMTKTMKHQQSIHTRRSRRAGATLIDVATGSMLLAVLLIPSIHLIGESRSVHRRLVNRDTMLFEAQQLVERTKVSLSEQAAFDAAFAMPVDVRGSIPVVDGPDLTSRVRLSADSGLPTARLLSIVVDVWYDSNRDSQLDANETSETLRTQWASP